MAGDGGCLSSHNVAGHARARGAALMMALAARRELGGGVRPTAYASVRAETARSPPTPRCCLRPQACSLIRAWGPTEAIGLLVAL